MRQRFRLQRRAALFYGHFADIPLAQGGAQALQVEWQPILCFPDAGKGDKAQVVAGEIGDIRVHLNSVYLRSQLLYQPGAQDGRVRFIDIAAWLAGDRRRLAQRFVSRPVIPGQGIRTG